MFVLEIGRSKERVANEICPPNLVDIFRDDCMYIYMCICEVCARACVIMMNEQRFLLPLHIVIIINNKDAAAERWALGAACACVELA